jgi:serine/threonine-protein kinase
MGSGGSAGATDPIARHQHGADVLRARAVLVVACTLWLVVGLACDLAFHDVIGQGSLGFVVAVRLATSAFHVAVLVALFRDPLPPPSVTRPLVGALFPVSAAALTLIATRMGGLATPYITAYFVILSVQGLAIADRWQRSAPLAVLTGLMFPVGMLIDSVFDPVVRAQLSQPVAVSHFAVYTGVLLAETIVVAWGSHVIWSLRQSVFESRSIGRYKLRRRIGKGGMGEVWEAHDRATRRRIALKILSPEHGRSPAAIARFEREIQATAELAHPSTIRIFDWGVTDDGVWYYAMELLDGASLDLLVKRAGPLPVPLAVHLGLGAARAIAEAHGRGIVHRDVKPANLFVVAMAGTADLIKVLDFGVARIGDEDASLTQAGAVIGTPAFMPPEVAAGAPWTPAGDVWALAASLYFALTGRSPRDAGRPMPAVSTLATVPPALDDVLARALDDDPRRRYATAGELAAALAAVAAAAPYDGSFRLDAAPAAPAADVSLDQTLDAEQPNTRAEAPVAKGRAPR